MRAELEEHRRLRQRQRHRGNIREPIDGRCALRGVVFRHVIGATQVHRDRIRGSGAGHFFIPHRYIERPVTLLQQQIVHGCRLVLNRVIERAGREVGGCVGQNRREILQVGRLRPQTAVAVHEAVSTIVVQIVDEGVAPALLDRIQKEIQVSFADLSVGKAKIAFGYAVFRVNPWQRQKLAIGICWEVTRGCAIEVPKSVPNSPARSD